MAYRFSALGDVAMTVPVLACVTEQNPGLRVSMVSRPFFAPLFKEWAQVDFVPADVDNTYKGLAGLNRLYGELHRREPQAVADLHNVLRTRYLDFRFRLAGLPVEILDKGRREKRRLIRRGALASAPLRPMHERYADVFRRLGLQVDLSRYRPRRPALHQDTALFLDMFRGQKRVGVAPLARHTGKQYPLGGTKEVLQRLLSKTAGTVFFLFGAPDEKKLLDTLVMDPNRVFNLAGLFDFERELEIISHLDMMWAMDSGNGHLAAIYGVPVFTVWGITHPYAGFAPLGQTDEWRTGPDLTQYPRIPCSVYGKKICKGYEAFWDSLPPEKVAEKLLLRLQEIPVSHEMGRPD